MRGNEFLDKMELIAPAYIEAAGEEPKSRKRVWRHWGTIAACLCCVAAVLLVLPHTASIVSPGGSAVDSAPHSKGDDSLVVERTSNAYDSLEELLADLSGTENHDNRLQIKGDGSGILGAQAEGHSTVSFGEYTYQITDDRTIGIYRKGARIGTMNQSTEYLFESAGRLISVGSHRMNEVDLDSEYCTEINIFDVSAPEKPRLLDQFAQLGTLTACYMVDARFYLMTSDGVCACGWSRLDSVSDYVPRLYHSGNGVDWTQDEIRILGEPGSVQYVAVTGIDTGRLEVTGKCAYYGDIQNVFYGDGWFAFATRSATQISDTLYTFDASSMTFTGKVDTAAALDMGEGVSPSIVSVLRHEMVWRIVGKAGMISKSSDDADQLFALTFDSPNGGITKEMLRLAEKSFTIDDVFWEENRAIVSIGFFSEASDGSGKDAQIVFAEFDHNRIAFYPSKLPCSRVTGIDGIYAMGQPLGEIHPFISLGNGIFLRYNSVPNGFDIYDFTDSPNPKCLYRSTGDIPEGCRLDFDHMVYNENTIGVKIITPTDGDYRSANESWCVFYVAPTSEKPFAKIGEYAQSGIHYETLVP